MKLNSPCSETGCLNGGHFHPVNQHPLHGAWVSPKLYCLKHRKGKGSTFLDETTAVRRYPRCRQKMNNSRQKGFPLLPKNAHPDPRWSVGRPGHLLK